MSFLQGNKSLSGGLGFEPVSSLFSDFQSGPFTALFPTPQVLDSRVLLARSSTAKRPWKTLTGSFEPRRHPSLAQQAEVAGSWPEVEL